MKIIEIRPLASRVLAVAVEPEHSDKVWSVYIDAVAGESHKIEAIDVANMGNKANKKIACAIFPEFKKRTYNG